MSLAGVLIALVPVCGLVLAGMSGVAAGQKAEAGKAAQGETIFKTQCIGCHNKQVGDTTPFGPPNLHGIIGPIDLCSGGSADHQAGQAHHATLRWQVDTRGYQERRRLPQNTVAARRGWTRAVLVTL